MLGGIDAARSDALRFEQRERVRVAIESDYVVVARFTQQMSDALADQTRANEGNLHVHLLKRCESVCNPWTPV